MTLLRTVSFGLGADRRDDDALAEFRALDRPPPGGPARAPHPDSTLLVAVRERAPVARASYRVARGLMGAPERTGVVGHYEARDETAGLTLLEEAVARLAEAGAALIVGPMDGTTWDRYRLALPGTGPEGTDPAPFLTEPVNPAEYPAHFDAAGFRPVEHYLSRIVTDLDALDDRTSRVADAMARAGFAFAPFDPDRFDDHLDEIYHLSVAAFADNPYYAPIAPDAFRESYRPVRSFVVPELIALIRDDADRLAGFAFAFPDLLDPAGREGRTPRVVLKSLAVAGHARGAGLGSVLVHEIHRRAAARGHPAVIHALMHTDNPSHRISQHGGDIFRQYALFGRWP